jgi:hypothetical protein
MNRTEQGQDRPQPNQPSSTPMEPGKKPMEHPMDERGGPSSTGSWTGDPLQGGTEQQKPKVDPDGQQPR